MIYQKIHLQKTVFLNKKHYDQVMTKKPLYKQNIIACVWDFDKTLIALYANPFI